MVLQIQLVNDSASTDAKPKLCYLPEEVLMKPHKIDSLLSDGEFAIFKGITVQLSDDEENVVVRKPDGSTFLLSCCGDECSIKEASAGGESVHIAISVLPRVEPLFDGQEVSCSEIKINEYDPFEETLRTFIVDRKDYEASDTDVDAALRVAESIAEQAPEALEIIADYMADAAELGSKDARDWLADYHSDDGRYDPLS